MKSAVFQFIILHQQIKKIFILFKFQLKEAPKMKSNKLKKDAFKTHFLTKSGRFFYINSAIEDHLSGSTLDGRINVRNHYFSPPRHQVHKVLEVVSKPHLRPNGCVAPLARDSHLIFLIRVQHSLR